MNIANNTVRAITALLTTFVMALALPSLAAAQEASAEKISGDTSDKTGTNPVNFQRDLRFYNEYSWLNTLGDGSQNVLTAEYRQALFDGEWQFRARVPFVTSLEADFNNDGIDDIDESGVGDANFRLLKKPWFKGRHAIAIAMEFFLNTASEDALGAGTTTLGPQMFYAYFFGKNPIPIPGYRGGGLFAPGIQYRFSIDEDAGRSKTDAIAIDINYLAMSEDKKRWLYVNPQILSDQENNQDYAFFDIEFGWVNLKRKGQSWYIRPTFTIGADRPSDYGLEFGYKFVGW
ncbi:MAG: hypothetical protein ACR2QZ_07285 [Woeseiaceae bacterium]